MGTYNREYKGISFTIDTHEQKRGRWRWSYTLGMNLYEIKDAPLQSEILAIGEAEDNAHHRIDSGETK